MPIFGWQTRKVKQLKLEKKNTGWYLVVLPVPYWVRLGWKCLVQGQYMSRWSKKDYFPGSKKVRKYGGTSEKLNAATHQAKYFLFTQSSTQATEKLQGWFSLSVKLRCFCSCFISIISPSHILSLILQWVKFKLLSTYIDPWSVQKDMEFVATVTIFFFRKQRENSCTSWVIYSLST